MADARATRTEADSLGEVEVPADRYWGAQTQRSIENFPIGRTRFVWGRPMIEAIGLVKWAAARTNAQLGLLDPDLAAAIEAASDEVVAGELDDHFPLVVWQTGSGTQTNMNANEVIANRAIELLGGVVGTKSPVHPNDHVNLGQSSNDLFPTAMHVAVVQAVHRSLLPGVDTLIDSLTERAAAFSDVVVVGRTHLQDATPLTLGQIIGGWIHQLEATSATVQAALPAAHELAIGGTAVGTGLNTHPWFGSMVSELLATRTGHAFVAATDRFAALSAHDAMVAVSAGVRSIAVAAMKIANDVRWSASGPRTGIGELVLPANEPGSSIMPGKVNPTQAEALTMVVAQVMGNDATVAFAGSQGNFQLNVFKPVIAHNVLESIELLGEACGSFALRCIDGLDIDRERIATHLSDDLMLATALNPHIGYDRAAEIAKLAVERSMTLRDAAVASGHVTGAQFDEWVDPLAMTRPNA